MEIQLTFVEPLQISSEGVNLYFNIHQDTDLISITFLESDYFVSQVTFESIIEKLYLIEDLPS